MCGQCTETGIVFEIAEKEAKGEEWSLTENLSGNPMTDVVLALYLQETEDFAEGLEAALREAIAMAGYKRYLNSQVILCRTMEVLIKERFDSDLYQTLINNHLVKWAIEKECSRDISIGVLNLIDPRPPKVLHSLYNSKTYLNRESWQGLMGDGNLKDNCLAILQSYNAWWLEGKGLKKGNPAKVMEEIGIYDPLDERDSAEVAHFNLIFRALFFSLLVLSETNQEDIHLEIAKKDLAYVPDFDGLDLWLRRKAVVSVLRTEGVQALLPYIPDIHSGLIYYAALRAGLAEEAKRLLSESMLSKFGPDDLEARSYAKALVGEDCNKYQEENHEIQ